MVEISKTRCVQLNSVFHLFSTTLPSYPHGAPQADWKKMTDQRAQLRCQGQSSNPDSHALSVNYDSTRPSGCFLKAVC